MTHRQSAQASRPSSSRTVLSQARPTSSFSHGDASAAATSSPTAMGSQRTRSSSHESRRVAAESLDSAAVEAVGRRAQSEGSSASLLTATDLLTSESPSTTTTAAAQEAADAAAPRSPITAPVKKKRIRAKTERRREQCRLNQARYRDKQLLAALTLEDAVEQLQRQVEQLRLQRQSLSLAVNLRDRAVQTMLEYFRLFRFGLAVVEEHAGANDSSTPSLLNQQLAFVNSVFDENIRIDDARGRAFFLEQSRRFPTQYDNLATTLERYDVVTTAESSTTIVATVAVDVTISLRTIRYVFPHLLRSEHDALRRKLLGCRLDCPSSTVFHFDARGQVVGLRWTVDLIVGLKAVLTLREVAVVLQHAQIACGAYLLQSGEELEGVDAPEDENRTSRTHETVHGRGQTESVEDAGDQYSEVSPRWRRTPNNTRFHMDYEDGFGGIS